jgi:hypothetical protein
MKRGEGRRTWRELYPAEEWSTVEGFTVHGIKYVLFRQRVRSPNPPAAVLSFDGQHGMLLWEVVNEGNLIDVTNAFMQQKRILTASTSSPREPRDYHDHPDFGRF